MPGDPSEYARVFEALHKTDEDRRLFIKKLVNKAQPSLGHRALGSLIASDQAPCIFTTNFDSLIEDSATVAGQSLSSLDRAPLTVAALDGQERASSCLRNSEWPLLVKLHGDYRSLKLKNVEYELKEQAEIFRAVLEQALQRFGLVIAGYSGRDESVMSALKAVLRYPHAYPKGIYWLCPDPATLLPAVKDFIQQAQTAQVEVHIITGATFDELLGDIADRVELPVPLVHHIFGDRKRTTPAQIPLNREPALRFPVLRLTAIPLLEMPTRARKIILDAEPSMMDVRQAIKESKVWAVVGQIGSPRTLAAFGDDAELIRGLAPFRPRLSGEVILDATKDSWAKGLLYDAMVRAICRRLPLYARFKPWGNEVAVLRPKRDLPVAIQEDRAELLQKLQATFGSPLTGVVNGTQVAYSEGLSLRLDLADDQWWLVFEPTTFLDFPRIESESEGILRRKLRDEETAKEWLRKRWVTRRNEAWSNILDAWVHLLSYSRGNEHSALDLSSGEGIDGRFVLGMNTAKSRPAYEHDLFNHRRGAR
ncbi:SIR2 family protein [Paucibacter sp. B2R-40]|uniref:SIR2 family protein n=1 Tax=Paucibacter sp. B2R-40 TaxID=2893554 RepID=UPI0021E4985D|nr:SIR2 family protein [Paucibacter sp. B2R-40]MCV2355411.1 SIR2 family protein [Paucibacter sp. B2R-40]